LDFANVLSGSFPGVEPDLSIGPGALVRSYDFAGIRDCYVEGEVMEVTPPIEGCPRYKIQVSRRVLEGRVLTLEGDDFVYPPVNGTPTMMGKLTNFVVRTPVPPFNPPEG
jgi:hypothetical protein